MNVCHIVACSESLTIGRNNELPWHLPLDLKFFKTMTMNRPIIMGSNTFHSIGRPLPGRLNLVLTRNPAKFHNVNGIVVCESLSKALSYSKKHRGKWGEDVYIIGGANLYASSLKLVNTIYLTYIRTDIGGDAFYPEDFLRDFEVVRDLGFYFDSKMGYYTFLKLEKYKAGIDKLNAKQKPKKSQKDQLREKQHQKTLDRKKKFEILRKERLERQKKFTKKKD